MYPIKRGLICWLDARDGSGTQTTWVDRSGNENNAILHNSNFDSNGGWTGTGLKLDGVKDYVELNLSEAFKYVEIGIKVISVIPSGWNRMISFDANNMLMSLTTIKRFDFKLDKEIMLQKDFNLNNLYNLNSDLWKDKNFKETIIGKFPNLNGDYSNIEICYIRFYSDILTPEEIQQNLEYEKNINRETVPILSDFNQADEYGIGMSHQLSNEQLKTFRLSNDKTKFVAGMKYCKGLKVEKYTYYEVLDIMNNNEWSSHSFNLFK